MDNHGGKTHGAMKDHERKTMVPGKIIEEEPWCHERSRKKNHGAMKDHGGRTMGPWIIMEEKPMVQ